MTEAEQIARGLTKPQRTACWNLDQGRWQRAPHDGWRRSGQACSSLCRIGLAEKYVEDCGVFYRLTPLGLATALTRARAFADSWPEDDLIDDESGFTAADLRKIVAAAEAGRLLAELPTS